MEVRCPQCHHSIDLPQDASLSDIACPSCGSSFSLLGDAETVAYESAETRTLGHFDLTEQIGAGAFAVVFKARDRELDRIVAVKIPRKEKLGPSETEQFLREARAAAQLRHPNIVSVHEVGREDDTVFIVSDHIDGLTLADWLTGQQLTSREAAGLCAKIAGALHHAHESGVIHRDLKPANIMLDAHGEPHVMDFGLARREAGEVTMTLEGKVMGTPAYMSPEQARGEAHHADRRTDVYSLGVILFELLTGEKPFRGNVRMLLHQVINDDAPSPRRLNGTIPRDLETICLKCLEKDPRKRYVSTKDVADELARFLEGQPIQARPIGTLGRAWRWCKRNPAVSSLAAGLAAALVVGLAGVTWQWIRAEGQWIRAERSAASEAVARRAADDARKKAVDEAKRRLRLLYVSDMNMAHQAWEAGNVDRVIELLDRYGTGLDEDGLRGFQWRHLRHLCERSRKTPSVDHGSRIWNMDLSPEGDMVATVGYGPDVKVWSIRETRRPQRKIPNPTHIAATAFSPDGRTLAYSGKNDVKLYDLLGGEKSGKPLPHSGGASCMAFSSDGVKLAAGGFDKLVRLWDVESQTELHSLKGHSFAVFGVAFSPDGKTLASASLREVIVWDVPSGTKRCVAGEDAATGLCVAFAPDGKTLASGCLDGTVRFWDPETGQPLEAVPERAPGYITSLAYSSDNRLAAGSADGSVILWDLKTNTKLDALRGHQEVVRSLRFSSDNAILASASLDGTVKLWDVAAPMPPDLLKGHTQQVTSLVFVPDGSAIVSGSFDRTVRFWDVHTGEELATLQPHQLGVQALAISRDGTTAASVSLDDKVAILDCAFAQSKQHLEQWMPFCAAFFPDGKRLAVCGAIRPVLKVWDWANRAQIYPAQDNSQQLRAVAISPDGQLLACGGWDKLVKLLDARTGEELQALPGHGGDVQCLAFSPDGKTLASGAVDNKVILWDVASYQQQEILEGHTGPINSLAFSPDARTLASASNDRTIRLWYLDAAKEAEILPEYAPATSVAFSPDGTILASGSGQHVRLWRTAGPRRPEELNVLTSLERSVRTIAEAEPQRQRRILDDLKSHLAASVSKGLLQRDIILAASTAWRLVDCGQYELAGELSLSFGEAIGGSKEPRFAGMANAWETAFQERCGRLDKSR